MHRISSFLLRKAQYSVTSIVSRVEDSLIYKLNRKRIPIFYFSKTKNVGDILNPYLIERISHRETFLVKSRTKKHILPIGSIMHFGTKKSIVWGSGIIHPDQVPPIEVLKKIQYTAIRGHLTKAELEKYNINCNNIPLGDPAVLLPIYYTPKTVEKRFKVGIVPHFIDAANPLLKEYVNDENFLIIDVMQNPENFIDQLVSCEFILSSSLHGLILSDSYQIPNAWVKFSKKVIGGNFKFQDYYTTTNKDNPLNTQPININNQKDLNYVLNNPNEFCKISNYLYDKNTLINCLLKIL